jgi:hypothetical protein
VCSGLILQGGDAPLIHPQAAAALPAPMNMTEAVTTADRDDHIGLTELCTHAFIYGFLDLRIVTNPG